MSTQVRLLRFWSGLPGDELVGRTVRLLGKESGAAALMRPRMGALAELACKGSSRCHRCRVCLDENRGRSVKAQVINA